MIWLTSARNAVMASPNFDRQSQQMQLELVHMRVDLDLRRGSQTCGY